MGYTNLLSIVIHSHKTPERIHSISLSTFSDVFYVSFYVMMYHVMSCNIKKIMLWKTSCFEIVGDCCALCVFQKPCLYVLSHKGSGRNYSLPWIWGLSHGFLRGWIRMSTLHTHGGPSLTGLGDSDWKPLMCVCMHDMHAGGCKSPVSSP